MESNKVEILPKILLPKKQSKSMCWKDYFENYYKDTIVQYDYKTRRTIIFMLGGVVGESVCQKGDTWSFREGFYTAYTKALKHFSKINDQARLFEILNLHIDYTKKLQHLENKCANLVKQIKKLNRKDSCGKNK